MKKLLKIIAWIVGSLLALILILVLVLPLVFDPNKYKDDIAHAVKTATGRDLKIEGKIGWTLFPRIGISTGRVELANAAGFGAEPFARVESATVRVALLPLLTGRVNVDTIAIEGLTLNLAKNAAGRTNWDDLARPAAKPAPAPAPTEKKEKPSAGEALAAVVINGVDIKHAIVNFRDATQNANYSVRDMSLQTGAIALGTPVDLRLALTLQYDQPVKQANLALHTALNFTGNALELRNFNLKLDDSTLTGAFTIPDLQKLALRFDLALDKFDLDRYLPSAPAPTQKTEQAPAAAAPAGPVEVPLAALRSIDADGKLRIEQLKAFGVRASSIVMQIAARNGVITLGPNSAKLYDGTYAGRTVVNASGKVAQLTFDERLEKVQLGPLLRDANLFKAFSGEGNVTLKLNATGNDVTHLRQTLGGNVAIAVRDGAIEGIDLEKIERQIKEAKKEAGGNAANLLKALPQLKPDKNDKTKFTKLGATGNVANGIVSNNDLAIEAANLRVTGSGKVNLVSQTFDNYTLRVTDVPLIITGPLVDPTIRPDLGAVGKEAVKEKKEEAVKKLEQKLKDRLKRH